MKKLVLLAGLVILVAAPASADTVIILNNGNGCGGSNCFGNVITLTITPTGGNTYKVTYEIDTTGNTNPGSAIAGVTFKFAEMTSATLLSAPGGTAGWTVSLDTLSANGCASGNQSPACTEDTAFVDTLNAASPTGGLAPLPFAGVYEWQFDVTATGAIDDVAIRALFGTMESSTTVVVDSSVPAVRGQCPAGYVKQGNDCVISHTETTYSYKQTGLISASAPGTSVPEPASIILLATGLAGLAVVRRRS